MNLTAGEADLQRAVIDLAILQGFRVAHVRPAQTVKGWRTPYEGHSGLPDLILARAGVVLLAELKTAHGSVTPEQRRWLTALGSSGRLWRPSDWPTITEELS